MSAFLVNKNHIAELVNSYYSTDRYYNTEEYHRDWINGFTGEAINIQADKFESDSLAIAFFLAWANCESIKARYGEESEIVFLAVNLAVGTTQKYAVFTSPDIPFNSTVTV